MEKKKLKLKHLLSEGFIGMSTGKSPVIGNLTVNKNTAPVRQGVYIPDSDEPTSLTAEQKQEFLEAVAKYNSYAKSIYREHSLREVVSEIKKICALTESVIDESLDEWYDRQRFKTEMKRLAEDVKLFEKTATEVSQLQTRLESIYEDMGTKLGKYFDMQEDQHPVNS